MRPDLDLSLAPTPGPFLQTADVASCDPIAHATPSACGREDRGGGTSRLRTVTVMAALGRPSPILPVQRT
jgi:hypothetical protein